ncbi:M24 family metallopeptidase [Tumebacillus permanentifrigoris]|uniref:Xaa-Pro aminopeptidase n=1 Tax=Tumebacillus permanentifrigoris TaxID=378543 RepID=A0A316D6N9_9BACL|nr:Xaa-Pro peptidase family protein [Tumebacillus permanentifrigoris]PWK11272.1 Xaa-Pro aminopeptidase [Tumebacillus permanentifrigoris]
MSIYDVRLSRIRDWMKQRNVEVVLVTSPPNVKYLTGFDCHPMERFMGLCLQATGEATLFVPSLEQEAAQKAGFPHIVTVSDTEDPMDIVRAVVGNGPFGALAIEKQQLTVARFEQLQTVFGTAPAVAAEELLQDMRMRKDEAEVAIMKKAAEIADRAVEAAVRAIAVGKTEAEIVSVIESSMKAQGASGTSFPTIVLAGEKSALPHGVPGNRTIQEGDFVLLDLGAVYEGYCSDITRTFVVGEPSDEQVIIYEAVLAGNLAGIMATKPGLPAKVVDAAARQTIEGFGYGEYFTHRVGHGLGIEVHEFPSMHGNNEQKLVPGMVFTIEPGVYVSGLGGVRIEDDVLVTETGVEVLTKYPKELQILGVE